MEQLAEILRDLNVLIADTETFKLSNDSTSTRFELSRSLGQMKASRASLVRVIQVLHLQNQEAAK